jgi:hypothetical protein
MVGTLRGLALLLFVVVSGLVRADTYPAQSGFGTGGSYPWAGTWAGTKAASCSLFCPLSGGGNCFVTTVGDGICGGSPVGTQLCAKEGVACYNFFAGNYCPYGGTLSGSSCINAPACEPGYVRNGTTGQCEFVPTCAANETWNGASCECNAGYTRYNGVCTANCPAKGTAGPQVSIPATSSPGGFICYGSCQVQYSEASNQYSVGGVQSWYGKTYYTGSFCAPGDVAGSTQSSQPPSCPAGQVPGTINGQFACLPSSSSSPAQTVSSSSTTATNATGSTTGSSTTTTTTSDTGTGTTTTTTTTDRDGTGNVTGGSTTTKSVNDKSDKNDVQKFCEENPNASICKSSTWSGACGGFTCDGDAVQCAIAKEIHTRNCTLFNQTTPQSDLANAIIAGNDPQASQNPALESNRSNFSFTGAISQSPFLSQGGLTDQTIAFSGWSLVIPWSSLNQYLSIMGMIVVAFSLVAAARIVMGRA